MVKYTIPLIALLASLTGAQAQNSWPKEVFNPRPDSDDVILPMPCDGALALRKVITGRPPSTPEGALSDTQVTLGSDRNDARFLRQF